MTVLVVNAMILEQGRLSGIGHYVIQLLAQFGRINAESSARRRIVVFCRAEAAHHFAPTVGVEVVPVRAGPGRIGRVLTEQLWLPWRLRRLRADVLLNPAFTGPLWGAPCMVTTVHDLYFRVVPHLVPRAQRLFLSWLTPRCCRRSRRVIAPSMATRDDLVRFYPELTDKVAVIPLANRMSRAAPLPVTEADAPAHRYVLLVAALTRNKNPGPLLTAMAYLRPSYPDLTLMHIGVDPERLLADAVERHHASGWVSSRSGVSDDELAAAYRRCVCFVMPSLYEGFGLPLLEAQALGAPVVSSDRGSLPEVGGEGALYVAPTDATAIAAAIETLIVSPARRQALREAGLANQARFSWAHTARQTWNLLFAESMPHAESAEAASTPAAAPVVTPDGRIHTIQ